MNTPRSLSHSGTVIGTHRRTSSRTVRARVVRGILALAVALGGAGAVAATALGHSAGHAHHAKVATIKPWMW
jgi:hypothetical protein